MVSVMENTPTTMPDIIKCHIPIADRWDENILVHLDRTTEFIRAALAENEGNKVLVHCFQGISRSATVVCAYIIAQAANGMTATEAIDLVRVKRGIVCPNTGFRIQLATYSERFVGNRGAGATNVHPLKISDGIASRLRSFKTRFEMPSARVLQQIKVKEGM